MKKFGVKGFPTILLIKSDGTVVEFNQRVNDDNLNVFVANNANANNAVEAEAEAEVEVEAEVNASNGNANRRNGNANRRNGNGNRRNGNGNRRNGNGNANRRNGNGNVANNGNVIENFQAPTMSVEDQMKLAAMREFAQAHHHNSENGAGQLYVDGPAPTNPV